MPKLFDPKVTEIVEKFAKEGWTTRAIAATLQELGYAISQGTVHNLIRRHGWKCNRKKTNNVSQFGLLEGANILPSFSTVANNDVEPDIRIEDHCLLCNKSLLDLEPPSPSARQSTCTPPVIVKEEIRGDDEILAENQWNFVETRVQGGFRAPEDEELDQFIRTNFEIDSKGLEDSKLKFCGPCLDELGSLRGLRLKLEAIQLEYDQLHRKIAENFQTSFTTRKERVQQQPHPSPFINSGFPEFDLDPPCHAGFKSETKTTPDLMTSCTVRLERIDVGRSRNKKRKQAKVQKKQQKKPKPKVASKPAATDQKQKPKKPPHVPQLHQCEICGQSFLQRQYMELHIKIKHYGELPIICTVCGAGLTSKLCLKLHMAKHTGRAPYVCDYCPERFTGKMRRREHLVKFHAEEHLREKPHFCTICYWNFGTEAELEAHNAQIHDRNTCRICDPPVVFRDATKHKYHMMVHRGEKPFACPHPGCGLAFRRKDHLRTHEKKIHFRDGGRAKRP